MRTGNWSIPSADDGALTWATMPARDAGHLRRGSGAPRRYWHRYCPTATDTAATLAAAEQGRANVAAMAEQTMAQLAEAKQQAREDEQRAM
jgi:hypothetical protein